MMRRWFLLHSWYCCESVGRFQLMTLALSTSVQDCDNGAGG